MRLPTILNNISVDGLWTANDNFAPIWSAVADQRDFRTDNLPLMNSMIWPIGL